MCFYNFTILIKIVFVSDSTSNNEFIYSSNCSSDFES